MRKSITVDRCIRIGFSMAFLAAGVWIIYMAHEGRTPAQALDKPGDRIIMGVFGAMFCTIGVMGTIHALLALHTKGPVMVAAIAAVASVLFGLCFLSVAILQPGEIVSTSSLNGIELSRSKGGWGGAVVFSIVGLLPIILVTKIYKAFKRTLEKEQRSRLKMQAKG